MNIKYIYIYSIYHGNHPSCKDYKLIYWLPILLFQITDKEEEEEVQTTRSEICSSQT